MKTHPDGYLLSIVYHADGKRAFSIWLRPDRHPKEQLTIGGEKGSMFLVVYKPPRAIIYDIDENRYTGVERVFSRSNARLLKDIFQGQMLSDLETYFWQRKMPEV